jgi:nucleotidyltransferase/DNA polymerase involved in DNA repair
LQETFGRNYAEWLPRVARGVDDRPVVISSEPKSMSRETTFERDLHVRQDRPALSEHFTALCKRVSEDLVRKGYVGRAVGIKLRFADFKTVTRDVTFPEATADAIAIGGLQPNACAASFSIAACVFWACVSRHRRIRTTLAPGSLSTACRAETKIER